MGSECQKLPVGNEMHQERKQEECCLVLVKRGCRGLLLLGGLWMEAQRSLDLLSQKVAEVC